MLNFGLKKSYKYSQDSYKKNILFQLYRFRKGLADGNLEMSVWEKKKKRSQDSGLEFIFDK